jgi:hypothetical protein
MKTTATVLSAIETAVSTTNLSPADLLVIAAEALAETGCKCRALPTRSELCRACVSAGHLASIADRVEMHGAMTAITEACGNSAVGLVDLLPGIIEGILARDPAACTCDATETCTICTAARMLDDLALEMKAS